jgi:5-methyltetrahydropteroyltriglutamate--homocysteine methyltransferase
MLHMRPGRAGISRDAYPDLDEFWHDVAQAYRDEIRDLAAAGCTYLQLDDTSFAYLCDAKFCASMRERGDDPGGWCGPMPMRSTRRSPSGLRA